MTGGNRLFIKICGITRLQDARIAIKAGANALGFIFAASPRRLSPRKAAAIAAHVHPSVRKFGVFVDAPMERILEVVRVAGLDGVQLQGAESPEFVRALKRDHPRLFVAKVLRIDGPSQLSEAGRFGADAIFVDGKDPGAPMTPSKPLVDAWLEGAALEHMVLAGGLTPSNVSRLVETIRPWGVDVSSGVEESPGRKDAEKMRAFVKAVRGVELTEGEDQL